MDLFTFRPRVIAETGDDTPAGSLWRYVWRMSGRHQILICCLAVMVAALSMVPLELQKRIVNDAVDGKDLDLLVWLGVSYLAVLFLQGGFKFALRLYQGWLSESAVRYCRQFLSRVHECRSATSDTSGQGQAVSIIGPEIDRLGGFVGEGLSQPVVNLGMLLAVGGYMIVVDPKVALFSLLFIVPQIILVPTVQGSINRLVEKRLTLIRSLSDSIALLSESNNEAALDPLQDEINSIYRNRIRIFFLKFATKALTNLMNALAPLSVLMVGGYFMLQGETSIGILVAFISGFERIVGPLRELLTYYRVAAQAQVQHRLIAKWI